MSTVPHKYQQRSRTELQLGNSAITPENAIQKTGALSTIVKRIVLLCSKTLCFINFTTLFWPLSVPTTSKGAATLFCLRSFLTATAVSGCAKSIPRSQRRVRTATRSEGGCGKGAIAGEAIPGRAWLTNADECGPLEGYCFWLPILENKHHQSAHTVQNQISVNELSSKFEVFRKEMNPGSKVLLHIIDRWHGCLRHYSSCIFFCESQMRMIIAAQFEGISHQCSGSGNEGRGFMHICVGN